MATLALVPSYLAVREWRAWYLLRRFGVEVEGRVQHHWVGRIGLFDHYYVIYEFEGDDFFHSKHTEIDRPLYQSLARGEPPSVRPGVFRLKGQNPEPLNATFGSVLGWACAVFFILIGLS